MGGRDIENNTVEVARRDTKTKETVSLDEIVPHIQALLDNIQESIYNKALAFRDTNTFRADSFEEFNKILDTTGGFVLAHWDGTTETEEKIKEETKATIRCVPLDREEEAGTCIYSGKPSAGRVVFARAY